MKKHFQFIDHGSIVQIICLTDRAKEWLHERCQTESWQWMGDITLCVEPRIYESLYERIKEEFI